MYQFIQAAGSIFCLLLKTKVYQFRVLPFGLNTAPQVFTHLGRTVAGYLHDLGLLVIPYLSDWVVHHPDCQGLLCHQSQLVNTLNLVGFILNEKSELDLVQDIQFLSIHLRLDLGRALLTESKAREIIVRACDISSQPVLSYHRVSQFMGSLNWASGLNNARKELGAATTSSWICTTIVESHAALQNSKSFPVSVKGHEV